MSAAAVLSSRRRWHVLEVGEAVGVTGSRLGTAVARCEAVGAAASRPGAAAAGTSGGGMLLLGHDDLWARHAACADGPDVFFPTRGDDAGAARAICAQCPVVVDCLLAALDRREEHGVWGGASEVARRPMQRARAAAEHGGYLDDCRCRFCILVRDHLARLDGRRSLQVTFGDGARCGTASKYGRGCRCGECREAKVESLRRSAARKADRAAVAS